MRCFADSITDDYSDLSLFILEGANQIISEGESSINKIGLLKARAELFSQIGRYPESLQDFFVVKKLLESIENLNQDSTLLNLYLKVISDIGVIFIHTGKYEEAKHYFQTGLDYLNQIDADATDEFFKSEFFRSNLN